MRAHENAGRSNDRERAACEVQQRGEGQRGEGGQLGERAARREGSEERRKPRSTRSALLSFSVLARVPSLVPVLSRVFAYALSPLSRLLVATPSCTASSTRHSLLHSLLRSLLRFLLRSLSLFRALFRSLLLLPPRFLPCASILFDSRRVPISSTSLSPFPSLGALPRSPP